MNKYLDEYYNEHKTTIELGAGGQGVVYKTKGAEAIKLVLKNGSFLIDKQEIEKYKERFRLVHLLPLPKNLAISMPMALLKDHAGYVMRSLDGMHSLKQFLPLCDQNDQTKEEIKQLRYLPDWLSQMDDSDEKDALVHYHSTGSAKRRLHGLARVAVLLSRLHGSGLVYGDISDGNIFMHDTEDYVWFIDADNLRFEVENDGSCVYTPRYSAPELQQNNNLKIKQGRMSSDLYAFSVLAFIMLTGVEPIVSDFADEEEALYVDDEGGLPRDLILTKELKELFRRIFEDGYSYAQSHRRPVALHFAYALAKASDAMYICSLCGMSYYYETEDGVCPYCEHTDTNLLLATSYRYPYDKQLSDPCWQYVVDLKTHPVNLPLRLCEVVTMRKFDIVAIELILNTKNGITIKKREEANLDYLAVATLEDEDFIEIKHSIKMNYVHEFYLLVGKTLPRIIVCKIKETFNAGN